MLQKCIMLDYLFAGKKPLKNFDWGFFNWGILIGEYFKEC